MKYLRHELTFSIFAILILLGQANSAKADLIVTSINGTLFEAEAILGTATQGDDMVGMSVMVTFADMTSETVIWGATGLGTGEASGINWDLS